MYNFIFYFIFQKALKRQGNPKIPAAMFVWMAIMAHIFFIINLIKIFIPFNIKKFYDLILSDNYAKDEIVGIGLFFIPSVFLIVRFYSDSRIEKIRLKYLDKNLYNIQNFALFVFLIYGGLIGGIILG